MLRLQRKRKRPLEKEKHQEQEVSDTKIFLIYSSNSRRNSMSLLIFVRKSFGMTWKYLEAFGFQVLPSHLEEFYSEECKLNLEIHLESFGSEKD